MKYPWLITFLNFYIEYSAHPYNEKINIFTAIEVTTGKWRNWIGGMFFVPYAFAYMSVSGFAYLLRDWRWMHLAMSVPLLASVLFYWLV